MQSPTEIYNFLRPRDTTPPCTTGLL